MPSKFGRRDAGVALIVTLSVLLTLSLMAVSFARLATFEKLSASNYQASIRARLLARAGLEHAIGEIRQDFQQELFAHDVPWRYDVTDPPSQPSDGVGTGFPIERSFLDPNASPSYARELPVFGRNVSFYEPADPNDPDDPHEFGDEYTLKIFDTSSQLDLNSHPGSDPNTLGRMLDSLSAAIAKQEPYKSEVGDALGPLHGLGVEIVEKREGLGGFSSKLDVLGTYPSGTITPLDFAHAWDYLTVLPDATALASSSYYRRIRADTGSPGFLAEQRSPVNVNTASWPVLVAVFRGIRSGPVELEEADAEALAAAITARRGSVAFGSFSDLEGYVRAQAEPGGVLAGDPNGALKAAMVNANCNGNVAPAWLQADAPLRREVDKLDLSAHTTELTFFPNGHFEITSLGRAVEADGEPIASVQLRATVRLFDLQHFTTQDDFEGALAGPVYADPNDVTTFSTRVEPYVAGVSGLHAFSYPNNLQQPEFTTTTQILGQASDDFGWLQPVIYDLRMGVSVEDPANLLFRADFNGSYDGTSRDIPDDPGTGASLAAGTKPATGLRASDGAGLGVDGAIFRAADATTLHWSSREDGAPAHQGGNLPPLTGPQPDDGTPNQGALLLWFKIDRGWDSSAWRTIFFSNSWAVVPTPGQFPNELLHQGVQRELQLRVEGASDPRRVSIRTRVKFLSFDSNDQPVNPTPQFMPYPIIRWDREVVLDPSQGDPGLRAGEWYHLATRWKDGTDLGGFPGADPGAALVLHGQFFDSSDQPIEIAPGQLLHRVVDGPLGPGDQVEAYQPTSPNGAFDYVDPSHQAFGRAQQLHAGHAGITPSPEFVIDDLRISGVIDFFDDPGFRPERAVQPVPIATPEGDRDGIAIFFTRLLGSQEPNAIHVTVVEPSAPTVAASETVTGSNGSFPFVEMRTLSTDPSRPVFTTPIVDDVTLFFGQAPEFVELFDPFDIDSDRDAIPDVLEDLDLDGEVDPDETDPHDSDTDGDGLQDGTELGATLDAAGAQTDLGVFVPDADPTTHTDPLDSDTDGDGRPDGAEDANRNGAVDPGETDPNAPDPPAPIPTLPVVAGLAFVLAIGVAVLLLRRRRPPSTEI